MTKDDLWDEVFATLRLQQIGEIDSSEANNRLTNLRDRLMTSYGMTDEEKRKILIEF